MVCTVAPMPFDWRVLSRRVVAYGEVLLAPL